jgi:hypothetical protein
LVVVRLVVVRLVVVRLVVVRLAERITGSSSNTPVERR